MTISFYFQKSGIFGPDGPNGLGGQTGGQTGISTGGSSTGGPDGGLAAGGLETEFPDSDVNCDAVGTCYDGKIENMKEKEKQERERENRKN